jgi:hypothetical protein
MALRRLFSTVALSALAVAACGRGATGANVPELAGRHRHLLAKVVSPARVVALPDSGASFTQTDPDGTTRFISRGMRVLTSPDGTIERSRQLFPSGRTLRALDLPDRLGGGYLFYAAQSGSTQVWRAKTWTGDVEPFANLDFDVERIVDGFDRLYLQDQRSLDVVALDPSSGKSVDLGPLPPSPAYSGLAFADGWFGAAEVPFRGVLVSFDAGASWRPLGLSASYGVSVDHGDIVVVTASGRWVVDSSGTLRQRGVGAEDDALFVGAGRRPRPGLPGVTGAPAPAPEPPPAPPVGPLGKLPLRAAVLHGIPDSHDTAIVAQDGALARVRLSDGKLLDIDEHAFGSGGTCDGIQLGDGFGFVCGRERGGTTVYAFEPPLSLRVVLSFPEPRYVASSGNGALVVRGTCSGSSAKAKGGYCLRSRDGHLNEMRVRGDLGVERIVALSDGRTAVLVPPRLGAPGTLTLVEASGSATTVKLKLPKNDAPTLAMLKKGLWLEAFTERESTGEEEEAALKARSKPKVQRKKGKHSGAAPATPATAKKAADKKSKAPKKQLAGWVVAAGPFVGVHIDFDGTVHVGQIESDIDRAMISAQYALVLGRGGAAAETINGGFDWGEVELPPDSTAPAARTKTDASTERGCSRVGCVVGAWLRVGWRGKSDKPDLVTVDAPPPTAIVSSVGGRWNIQCAATGESAGGAAKPGRGSVDAGGEEGVIGVVGGYPGGYVGGTWRRGRWVPSATPQGDELKSSEWLSFKGVPGPAKKREDLGFDLGTEHLSTQIHAYAWGARGAAWDRVGQFLLRAYDPYSLAGAVWSTAVGRPPWNDDISASQVFGRDMNQPSVWYPTFEPSGRAVAILLQARGTTELLLAEEGHSAVSVPDVAKWGLYNQLNGAVKVGSTWYLGAYQQGSSFRLFKVEGGRVSLVREYPMNGGWRPNTTLAVTLVRNARADALGLWVEARRTRGVATSWFVYALDPDNGEVLDMVGLEPKTLATLPPACAKDADGWLLIGEPPTDPWVDFMKVPDSLRTRRVEAKLLVQDDGLCTQALVAEADTAVPNRLGRADIATVAHGRDTIPMVLEDRGRSGRRWGFRCVP